ncbi:MAG TPA: hypothetical protein VKI01_03885 [Acidimicrobiia bacterium]|nr:hypothetical protein [Acidimicrobiia bacterium]
MPEPESPRLDRRERWFGKEARTRLRHCGRRHWLFLVVLGVGLALRVVAQVAYRPSLLYIDSYTYLGNLHGLNPSKTSQPIGYEVLLLRPVLSIGNLAVVAAVQHVIGLAMGVVIYVLAVRLGARRWVAVLAAGPVLLDAYQLQIEQNIMSEPLFEALILAGVVLLLWKRPLTFPVLAIGGALLGLSATVRAIGVALVVPAVVFALVAGRGGWQRILRAAVIGAAFVAVIGAYCSYAWIKSGDFELSRGDAYLLYGRAATIVDCRGLDLPHYERVLCPNEALDDRLGPNEYAHHSPYPGRVVLPPGKDRDAVLRDFARRVFEHQPLDLAKHVVTDFAKGFAPWRTTFPGDVALSRWQFQREYPTYDQDPIPAVRTYGGGSPHVVEPLALFLRGYQLSVGYVPGSVLGVAFVAGLLATAGVGRARRSGLRAACLLPALCGLSVLFAADFFHFSWRYQLPALVLAPLSGALALTALTGWTEPRPANGDGVAATTGEFDSLSAAS